MVYQLNMNHTICILLVIWCAIETAIAKQQVLGQPSSFIDRSIFRAQASDYYLPAASDDVHLYDDIQDRIHAPYEGITTFAHLNLTDCFSSSTEPSSSNAQGQDQDEEDASLFDIAIVGAPFDLGVTYRPGARFGPSGARMGSRRLSPAMAYSMDHGVNPFKDWATVVDCGDVANSPFDKLEAIGQLQAGWEAVTSRKAKNGSRGVGGRSGDDGLTPPRIIGIGGDHTISLPAIRALNKTWGPVTVLHFDSHLDSWDPHQLGGKISKYSEISHGTMFHILHEQGCLAEKGNMHIGARSMLFDKHYDLENDARCGFSYIRAREIDSIGLEGVVDKIVATVKDNLVYLNVDIDVLDPAFAPATGTIEPGGWSTRELLHVIEGLSKAGIKIIGADVVEFSPVYDNQAQTTAIAVAQIIYEILQWMVRVPVHAPGHRL